MESIIFFGAFGLFLLMAFSAQAKRRQIDKATEKAKKFEHERVHTSKNVREDGFASWWQIRKAGLTKHGGFKIGRVLLAIGLGYEVALPRESHATVIGGTGVSKTASMVFPNLDEKASKALFDSKGGELTMVAGSYLASQGPVYVMAPHGFPYKVPRGVKLVSMNLMYRVLRAPREGKRAEAMKLSTALWPGGDQANTHGYFAAAAQNVMNFFMITVALYGKPHEQSIPWIARMVQSDYQVQQYCQRIAATRDPEFASTAYGYMLEIKKGKTSFSDVLQTMRVGLGEFLDPMAAKCFSGVGGPTFEALGSKQQTLILCERTDLTQSSAIARLWAGVALGALLDPSRPRKVPITMIVDEAQSLGPFTGLALAYMTARSFNVRVVSIFNSYRALLENHGNNAYSIMANSSVIWLGGCKDVETAEMVSKACGSRDVVVPSNNVSFDAKTGMPSQSTGASIQSLPVLSPSEYMGMRLDDAIALVRGVPGAVRLRVTPWFKQAKWRSKLSDNPFHSK